MSGDLVLITGASGHLGYRVVVNALERGYSVRAAVRSESKIEAILAAPSIKAIAPGKRLDFVIVPDICVDGAYDESVKEVKYIVHTASSLGEGVEDQERDVIAPAIKGTRGMLKSAAKASTVKRIVVTSSVLAVVRWEDFFYNESDVVYTAETRVESVPTPYAHPFQPYAHAKVQTLNNADAFVRTEKPQFDVIHVMPSFCVGRNELVTDVSSFVRGSNGVAFAQVLGHTMPSPFPGCQVHMDDVAKVHILSLDPKIKGNQRFGTMCDGVAGNKWEDALDIVRKHFPEAVANGRLPCSGAFPSKRLLYDCSKTEEVLGIKFRSFEESIVEITEHYLELLEKTKGER